MSTGLDELNWLNVKGIITDVFHDLPIKVTVHMEPEQQNVSPNWTQKEKGTKNEMQQAQEDDQSLSTVLSWVENGKKTPSLSSSNPDKRHLGSLEQIRLHRK